MKDPRPLNWSQVGVNWALGQRGWTGAPGVVSNPQAEMQSEGIGPAGGAKHLSTGPLVPPRRLWGPGRRTAPVQVKPPLPSSLWIAKSTLLQASHRLRPAMVAGTQVPWRLPSPGSMLCPGGPHSFLVCHPRP